MPRSKLKFSRDQKLEARRAVWPADDLCPLCGRLMVPGTSVNEHHLIPRMYGGIEKFFIHRICHAKIHSVLSESELAFDYNTFAKLKAFPPLMRFIKWVSHKDPLYFDKHVRPRAQEGTR